MLAVLMGVFITKHRTMKKKGVLWRLITLMSDFTGLNIFQAAVDKCWWQIAKL